MVWNNNRDIAFSPTTLLETFLENGWLFTKHLPSKQKIIRCYVIGTGRKSSSIINARWPFGAQGAKSIKRCVNARSVDWSQLQLYTLGFIYIHLFPDTARRICGQSTRYRDIVSKRNCRDLSESYLMNNKFSPRFCRLLAVLITDATKGPVPSDRSSLVCCSN